MATIAATAPAPRNLLAKLGHEFEDHRIEPSHEKSRDDAFVADPDFAPGEARNDKSGTNLCRQ